MNMQTFVPAYRSLIGLDRFAKDLDSAFADKGGYPPYNIYKVTDDSYKIEVAVAGYSKDDISISVEKGVLTISGKATSVAEAECLYKGISQRAFTRKWRLMENAKVEGASLVDGMLTVHITIEVPEHEKPKLIEIKT